MRAYVTDQKVRFVSIIAVASAMELSVFLLLLSTFLRMASCEDQVTRVVRFGWEIITKNEGFFGELALHAFQSEANCTRDIDFQSVVTGLQVGISYTRTSWNFTKTKVYRRYLTNSLRILIFCDSMPPTFSVPLEVASNVHSFYILHQLKQKQPLLKSFSNLKHKIEVTVTQGGDLSLSALYTYCNGGSPSLVSINFDTKVRSIFMHYTNHLNGSTLKVTSALGNLRGSNYRVFENFSVEFIGGYGHQILTALQQKFGCNYVFKPNTGYGIKSADGRFDGVVGGLQRGEFDYAIDAGFNVERFEVTEFLPPVIFESLTFLVGLPLMKPKRNLVATPFHPKAWAVILLLAVGFSVILGSFPAILLKAEGRDGKKHYLRHILRSLLFASSSLLDEPQGASYFKSRFLSKKLLAASWLLTSIVLGTAYTARLTTLMTFPEAETVPTNLDELAATDYNMYLHQIGGMPEFMWHVNIQNHNEPEAYSTKGQAHHGKVAVQMFGVCSENPVRMHNIRLQWNFPSCTQLFGCNRQRYAPEGQS